MAEGEVSVEGGFPARYGLAAVRDALAAGFPEGQAEIYEYGGELAPSLHFSTAGVFFASMYIPDEEVFLFDGGVQGSLEEAIAFTRRLSECLAAADVEHDFHVASGPMEYAASFVYPPEAGEAG
jgi:hypothetical protein